MKTFKELCEEMKSNYKIKLVDISTIRPGDTVEHDGVIKTVSKSNLGKDDFHGITLFGDSYHGGRKKVKKVIITRAMPNVK